MIHVIMLVIGFCFLFTSIAMTFASWTGSNADVLIVAMTCFFVAALFKKSKVTQETDDEQSSRSKETLPYV